MKVDSLGWINIFGLILVVLLLIPNIIYALKHRGQGNRCTSRLVNTLEQIGRYSCMFLIIFNIGIGEQGFSSIELFIVYVIGNGLLILAYWIFWVLFFIRPSISKQMALAIIPTLLFLLSGITMGYWLLVAAGVLFGASHIYVTYQNRQNE